MISVSAKVKLGVLPSCIEINPERWSNQYGWGLVLTIRLFCLMEIKFNLIRAYGERDNDVA